MARSYFLRIVALVPFILSGVSILSKANECHSIPDLSTLYNTQHGNWMFANNSYFNNQEPYASRIGSPFFYRQSYKWRFMLPRGKKGSKKETNIVHYQSEDSIVFDAKRNILELHGASSIAYDKMKLEADVVALQVNAHTIHAQGTKDLHNKPVGNPVFIYEDVTKNKYGKDDSTKTRTFFTEAIWYNIETKRALVRNLLTKQEEAIVRSKQVKKDDEETFYGQDIVFTTCALEDPHFSIRTKRAKLVQDQQITTGPFRFYFDKVPTPLGCFFGTLFLEGKRTHGIIPPEIGEGDDGFYLRNGGYYINFKDYVDISMLGSLYSSGTRAFKNELRYKKRYLCSGNLYYAGNIMEKETGWSLQWEHKTLTHGSKSFNANVRLHNKAYKTSDQEEKTRGHKKLPKGMEQQSSGSLSYDDQLVGLPYRLTLRAEYNNNLISNFKHWTLPIGTLSSTTWHPFRIIGSKGVNHWFHNIQISHSIHFENHFQNAKDEPKLSSTEPACSVPKSAPWNTYTENGLKHVIPLSVQWKVFEAINLKPHFNYQEGWYWLKKGTKGPIRREGFNRVYTWDFGAGLDTTLYHTHYFKDPRWIEGFRIKTAPSCSFTYTPDFSKQYFIEIEKEPGERVKAYAFKGLRPGLDLANRATSVVQFQLHNTVELKVKKAIDPEKKEKDRQRTTRKIFLLKNLDLETQYDFKATECHLTKGISLHIASEAKIGKIGKASFDLNVNFDPYLSKIVESASNAELLKIERIDAFSWNHGKYLGKVSKARFKIHMDFTHYANSQTKQKKNLLNDDNHLSNKIKENKIDFETPWNCGLEFNWIYTRLYEYKRGEKKYNTEKYIAFNGDITLVKKWKVGLRSTYNFTKSEFDPYATEISIQRDLHCWQLSYEWHPLGESAKYDFSLGVKANVLKALKLPRKRSYNKLK